MEGKKKLFLHETLTLGLEHPQLINEIITIYIK